jgi:hypothetical protein
MPSGAALAGALIAAVTTTSTQSAQVAGIQVEAITFEAAVQRALSRNPSLASARADIERASAIVRETRSVALPTLYGNASYTRLDHDRTLPGTMMTVLPVMGAGMGVTVALPGAAERIIAGANQLSANLTLTVPLVAPLPWANWANALDQVAVANASAEDVQRTVALATGRAYLAVIAQHRVAEATVQARNTARGHYEYAHTRQLGGVGHRLDEIRAAQELASDEAQVETAYSLVARAQEALGVLIGADHPVDAGQEPDLRAMPTLEDALQQAMRSRADIHVGRMVCGPDRGSFAQERHLAPRSVPARDALGACTGTRSALRPGQDQEQPRPSPEESSDPGPGGADRASPLRVAGEPRHRARIAPRHRRHRRADLLHEFLRNASRRARSVIRLRVAEPAPAPRPGQRALVLLVCAPHRGVDGHRHGHRLRSLPGCQWRT